jgi:hypothetical protein
MRMIMLLRRIGPAVLTLLFSASLFAAEPMSADEVKSLLTDNTMNGVNLEKNKKFTNFFKSDGTAIKRNAKGKMKTGKWHVNDNGEHCTNWGKGDRCGAIIKVRENIYQKMDGDKPRVEFNTSRGNPENL